MFTPTPPPQIKKASSVVRQGVQIEDLLFPRSPMSVVAAVPELSLSPEMLQRNDGNSSTPSANASLNRAATPLTFSARKISGVLSSPLKAFVTVVHQDHGILLLRCTRKKKKGDHYQLPGGRVDKEEVEGMMANFESGDNDTDNFVRSREGALLAACQMGCARELWEETGIDVRGPEEINRLKPMRLLVEEERLLGDDDSKNKNKDTTPIVVIEYKNRVFFNLRVTDSDFADVASLSSSSSSPLTPCRSSSGCVHPPPSHLRLRLSHEHSGFAFADDPLKASHLVKKHSGGVPSEAILAAVKIRDVGGRNVDFQVFRGKGSSKGREGDDDPYRDSDSEEEEGSSGNKCECWNPFKSKSGGRKDTHKPKDERRQLVPKRPDVPERPKKFSK